MTAPGQEPDEATIGKPGGEDPKEREWPADRPPRRDRELELDKIGDSHMPEDMRRKERGDEPGEDPAESAEPGESASSADEETE